MQTSFYAHTATNPDGMPDPDQRRWQLLRDHLRQVARLAKQFAEPFGVSAQGEAELAGLLHDLGKYRQEFQQYLRGERVSGSETQHAIYGAAWAFAAQQIAMPFAIAGHHAGLHDRSDLEEKVTRPAVKAEVPALVNLLESELDKLPTPPGTPHFVESAAMPSCAADSYTRFIFSCVVDADRLDTAAWPAEVSSDRSLEADRLLTRVIAERERKRAAVCYGPVAQARNQIFDACLSMASETPGFFSLTVPTGGGKTLASMAFALAHAKAHGLRRVIVVIPYLSIIEQNAAEYRRILGNNIVLESHSAASPRPDLGEAEREQLELAAENWDAPIVVTTSVQFIESLFAASPSRCRKLHRVARSVVVFDEVQTLPAHLLQPLFSVLRELHRGYGTSFVFSSATQPAFRRSSSLPEGCRYRRPGLQLWSSAFHLGQRAGQGA